MKKFLLVGNDTANYSSSLATYITGRGNTVERCELVSMYPKLRKEYHAVILCTGSGHDFQHVTEVRRYHTAVKVIVWGDYIYTHDPVRRSVEQAGAHGYITTNAPKPFDMKNMYERIILSLTRIPQNV